MGSGPSSTYFTAAITPHVGGRSISPKGHTKRIWLMQKPREGSTMGKPVTRVVSSRFERHSIWRPRKVQKMIDQHPEVSLQKKREILGWIITGLRFSLVGTLLLTTALLSTYFGWLAGVGGLVYSLILAVASGLYGGMVILIGELDDD
jgi:hypothetical protein